MQDTDGDSRADRIRLTYSERVRHAADGDGKYPFRVAGYRVRGRMASSRTIVLSLAEPAAVDDTAKPSVRYARTGAGRVVDLARNQAVGQMFRATNAQWEQAGGHADPDPDPDPDAEPTPRDTDGDGVVDAQDCGPTDPAISPGAADQPDLAVRRLELRRRRRHREEGGLRLAAGQGHEPGHEGGAEADASRPRSPRPRPPARTCSRPRGRTTASRPRPESRIYGGYDAKSWKRGFARTTRSSRAMPEGVFADKATGVAPPAADRQCGRPWARLRRERLRRPRRRTARS